ncbi:phage minor capsid protein [Metabacillus fastidiosus]|uniref:Minor capsid protein n=1 Tax=Metabacillus fastidiosus TaxID=1458 RepID=A0ABU6NRK0_9BACI|nr:phage minor capsid protein [Metabacillus fastidiosus]MED4399785.1 hypothetical protein [Metabacillus fastidiosus]
MDKFLEKSEKIIQAILQIVQSNPDWLDKKKKNEVYKAVRMMLDHLLNEAEAAVPAVIETSFMTGVKEGLSELDSSIKSGLLVLGTTQISSERFDPRKYIRDIQFDAMLDLKAAIRTAKIHSINTIETALEQVNDLINSGMVSGEGQKFIRQKVADAFAKQGLTAFVTRDGKKLPLDYYTNLVVNTKFREAKVQGKLNYLRNGGVEAVKITGRGGSCGICGAYRGMVVSLTGEHDGIPSINDVRMVPYHPHCRCFIQSYFIGIKTEEELQVERDKWTNFNPNIDKRTAGQKQEYNAEQERKRRLNEEKKQYARWKSVLGDETPASLSAFRRMKRQNTIKFQEMQSEYHSIMQVLSVKRLGSD